jgi:N-acetylglutamate synthase-like GNAT family acetyltransferase
MRRARPADVAAIHALIAHNAALGLLLPRTEEEIRAHVSRFLVLVERKKLVGCAALEPYGSALAEVRSLAVEDAARGRGLGARLLHYALAEAKRRRFARVFAVTHAPHLFEQQGFALTTRFAIPEKVARDCRACPKARNCELIALVAVVAPERAALPVLRPAPAV